MRQVCYLPELYEDARSEKYIIYIYIYICIYSCSSSTQFQHMDSPQGLCNHTHWTHYSRQESSGQVISQTQRSSPDNTQQSQQRPFSRRDSKPHLQQASSRRPTPQTARRLESPFLKMENKSVLLTKLSITQEGKVIFALCAKTY